MDAPHGGIEFSFMGFYLSGLVLLHTSCLPSLFLYLPNNYRYLESKWLNTQVVACFQTRNLQGLVS